MSQAECFPSTSSDMDSEFDKSCELKEIKRRNRLNARQVNRLMEVFDQTTKPKTEIRIKLAEELEMHPRAVQIWFQNRRQKLKKGNHEHGSSEFQNPIEAAKLTLSHPGSFLNSQPSTSYVSDLEYSYLVSPTATSFNLKAPTSYNPNTHHKSDEPSNTLLYSVRGVPECEKPSSNHSHDSLTLLHTCDTTALQNQSMFDLSKLSQDPSLFSESIETPNILTSSYPEDFGTTPTVYSGLGSLGLDLSTQIDLLQQQSFNTSYVNKKKTSNSTDEFNWTDCNMPLDATKMNAMKNRANTKSRSKSFQHQEDVDSDSAASPWNRLSRSNSSDFQLKQPPLKKRRHTTSMLEFY